MLREKQRATLSGVRNITWHDSIDDVPEGPAVILANEYFDVLPIHQVVKRETGWHERVGRTRRRRQAGVREPRTSRCRASRCCCRRWCARPLIGAVFEWRPDAEIMKIAARVRDQDGAALIIDYGHLRSDAGDTFQAIARHSFADPAEESGPGRRHRPCRFPGAGARRRRSRRAGSWPGDAGRFPQAARHRDPRGDADGESHAARFPPTFPAR